MKNTIKHLVLIIIVIFSISSCNIFRKGGSSPRHENQSSLSPLEQIEVTALFIEANKEKIIGNFSNAKALYADCIRKDPKNHAAMYELAGLLLIEENFNDGILLAREAVRLDDRNEWYYVLLIELYQKSRLYNEAIKTLKDLVELSPENINYQYELANSYLHTGRLKEAINIYNHIEETIGITEEISVQKHTIYLYMGKIQKAIEELEKLIAADPENIENQLLLANVYIRLNYKEEAFRIFENILTTDPNNGSVNLSLANYYRTQNDDTKAFTYTQKAFANPDINSEEKINILLSYYEFTDSNNNVAYKEEAYILLDILISTHPQEAVGYSMYADFLVRDKKLNEAKDMLLKVIELDKTKYLVWEQLLSIELEQKNFISLDTLANIAISLFPEHALLYLYSGYATFNLRNFEKTVETLNQGVAYSFYSEQMTLEFYTLLGESYNHLKNYEKSDSAFNEAIKISPDSAYLLNNYSYYLSLRADKLDLAKELSEKANQIVPNSPSFQDTYAWILYKQGDYENALIWLEKALENGGITNAVILEHYGDVLFRLNKKDDAIKQWEKAKEVGNGSVFLDEKIRTKTLIEE
ncbi:MAG: tetratricopeptide repeat protein [Bacteroidales bacterium]|nr:tetratricopeptide repeat protein [Bacteroidales bacterium]